MKQVKNSLKKIKNLSKNTWVGIIVMVSLIAYFNRASIAGVFKEEEAAIETLTQTVIVQRENLRISISQEGTVFFDKYDIGFQSNGIVRDIQVSLGDEVKKDDYLAAVDATDASIQYQQEQADYAKSKIGVDLLKGLEYDAKKAAFEQAEYIYELEKQNNAAELAILAAELVRDIDNQDVVYDRVLMEEEYKVDNANDPDFQEDLSDYVIEMARNDGDYFDDTWNYEELIKTNQLDQDLLKAADNLESAELALKQHEASIKESEIGLQNTSRSVSLSGNKIADTKLYSPVDGRVVAIYDKLGEHASPVFMRIIDVDNIYFEVFVEDIEWYEITPDMRVSIEFGNLSESYTGKVIFISPSATDDSGSWSTYRVVVQIEPSDDKILDGLIGDIEFIISGVDDVLVIPNESVYREDGISYVNVVDGEDFVKTKVKLGFSDGVKVEVVEGLLEKDQLTYTKQVANDK